MRDVFVADLAGIGGEVAQAVAEGAVKEFAARVGHDCEGGTSYQCAFHNCSPRVGDGLFG